MKGIKWVLRGYYWKEQSEDGPPNRTPILRMEGSVWRTVEREGWILLCTRLNRAVTKEKEGTRSLQRNNDNQRDVEGVRTKKR